MFDAEAVAEVFCRSQVDAVEKGIQRYLFLFVCQHLEAGRNADELSVGFNQPEANAVYGADGRVVKAGELFVHAFAQQARADPFAEFGGGFFREGGDDELPGHPVGMLFKGFHHRRCDAVGFTGARPGGDHADTHAKKN